MFRTVLIANRGEVAARVARTCRRMGVRAVVVASAADRDQAWLAEADEVVCIGPARASGSYLDQDAILEAAIRHHCAAVHPGWGFLAENATFAERCAAARVTFIGPSAAQIRLMGDKARARQVMRDAGMPVIPGSDGPVDDPATARQVADELGYPVLLKAVGGGGGRGMRAVRAPGELADAFDAATAEALSGFADGRLYVERLITGGRHVEIQIAADRFGNVVHLGERECSMQRRHQKVVEEAPSPALSDAERARILPVVTEAVRKVGYRNVGTVEMLLDDAGDAWFMEMNTRLQVEHPVTEAITGIDLVEWQLRIAANQALPLGQDAIGRSGHAIECRINAEDPDDGFKPSPGEVTRLELPSGDGVRVDTHLRSGDRISPFYDSMVAKLIAHGPDRAAAIARMEAALDALVIEGVTHNVGLHRRILASEPFRTGAYDTTTLETELVG